MNNHQEYAEQGALKEEEGTCKRQGQVNVTLVWYCTCTGRNLHVCPKKQISILAAPTSWIPLGQIFGLAGRNPVSEATPK